MSRKLGQENSARDGGSETADSRLPLKGFHLLEDEWSPWYTDDFGLTTRISWQRASDRSILIHNLAAAPDERDPSSQFVHVSYEVDLPTGAKSNFQIHAEYLENTSESARRHLLATLDRAIGLAESQGRARRAVVRSGSPSGSGGS
ncbi:MAG: hypothetical protein AAGM22_12735 [Acidobacteriota bacterium]